MMNNVLRDFTRKKLTKENLDKWWVNDELKKILISGIQRFWVFGLFKCKVYIKQEEINWQKNIHLIKPVW